MRFERRDLLRMAALAVVVPVLQVAAVSQLPLVGRVDLVILVVAMVAVFVGSLAGFCVGFIAGLMVDLMLLQILGVSSIVLMLVGYSVGRYVEIRNPRGPLVPIFVGGVATLGAVCGFSIVQFVLGATVPVTFELLRQILVTVALNALFATPVFFLIKKILLSTSENRRSRQRRQVRRSKSPLGFSPLLDRQARR